MRNLGYSIATLAAFLLVIAAVLGVPYLREQIRRPPPPVESRLHPLEPYLSEPPSPLPNRTPDPARAAEFVIMGDRAYASHKLAAARLYYHWAVLVDGSCERCVARLRKVELDLLERIGRAYASGEQYLSTGRYDLAAGEFEKVLEYDPDPESVNHVHAVRLLEEARAGIAASVR